MDCIRIFSLLTTCQADCESLHLDHNVGLPAENLQLFAVTFLFHLFNVSDFTSVHPTILFISISMKDFCKKKINRRGKILGKKAETLSWWESTLENQHYRLLKEITKADMCLYLSDKTSSSSRNCKSYLSGNGGTWVMLILSG